MPGAPPGIQYEPQAQVLADLALLLAGTQWAAPTVHLFTNNIVPTKDTVVGDLTEASYTGYAAVALGGFGAPSYNTDGSITVAGDTLAEFVGPAGGSGPTVYGYFLKGGGAGTPLLRIVRFTTPVALTDDHNVLDIVVAVPVVPGQRSVA